MRKLIGIYQIIGGVVAVFFSVLFLVMIGMQLGQQSNVVFKWSAFNLHTLLFIFYAISFFLFIFLLFYAGIYLYKNTKKGYVLSLFLQGIQSVVILTPKFNFIISAPILLAGTLDPFFNIRIYFNLGLNFLGIQKTGEPINVGFNIISLILFLILLHLYRKFKKEHEESKFVENTEDNVQ